jgi:AcrR family transcriptional regulator
MTLLPRTRARVATRSERHEELLDGVEALFAEDGFRSVTLGDLTTRLRCSRRALYELAENRNDLVALVVGRFLDRNFERGVAAMDDHASARSRIEAFSGAVISDSQRISVAFADDIVRTPRTASLLSDYDERCARLVHDLVVDGQRSGEFRTCHPGLAAHGLMAAIASVQDSTVLAGLGLTYADATRGTVDIFLDGLTRRGRPEP